MELKTIQKYVNKMSLKKEKVNNRRPTSCIVDWEIEKELAIVSI